MKKLFSLLIGILITISSFASLPTKVFAPYVDVMLWPTFSLMNCYNATGQKYYTLAFITANGSGQPAWGGITAMSDNFMLDQIQQLRGVGGDVIVSFGGANGTPIDASITNVTSLVAAYSSVIDRYGLTWIDFDIEGYWVADQASIDRRNSAAKQLQTKYPGLRITYCLPVMPTGLTADGVNIINKAKAAGVAINSVNVMAMDYGGANSAMGQAAISAAQATRSQTGSNIGITPMIGQNDSAGEIFSLSNATEVVNFAKANSYVNMLAMWSATRDNGGCAGQTYASPTCSGVSQGNFAFINNFKSFTGTTGGCTPTAIVPYIAVNGGAWQNTYTTSVAVGANVSLGPQPTDGTWKWTGPAGFTSTSRQITISNIQTSQGGSYVANYTNPAGCASSGTFTITVTGGTGGGGSCASIPQYVENGGYVAGSKVKNVSNQYQCRPWPNSGWCNGAAWAYAPGTGTYWTDAWTLVGACTARMITEDINANEIILETAGMTVSPNPSRGSNTFTLTFDKKAGNVDVHLIHTNGMQVHSSHYENVGQSLEFNVPTVPQGIYLVKVRGAHETLVKKVIID